MARHFLKNLTLWPRACCPLPMGGLMGGVLLLSSPVASAESAPALNWTIEQSIGSVDSRWREKTPAGVVHVKERGGLNTATTTLTAMHPWADVAIRHQQHGGERDYAGVTNQGQRATSVSDVRNGLLGFSLLKKVNSTWALGLAVDRVAVHRDIRSVALASGYLEKYGYTVGKLGVQHQLNLSDGWHLQTHFWLGRAFDQRLVLRLPGFDAAKLPLGPGHTAEIAWQLVKQFPDSNWQASVQLAYRRDRFKASDAVTLFKGGRIAGSAQQPAWHHGAAQLGAGIGYRF